MNIQLTDIDNLQANAIDTDLRAETVAARLLSHGVYPDQVYIKRKGASKRGVLKDISAITLQQDGNNTSQFSLEIATHRNGIYDTLPEGLFHQTIHSTKSKSMEAILEEMKKRREEEFFNRRFFQPFEEEVDRSRIMTHLKELRFDKKNSEVEFIHIFIQFWPILKHINQRKAAIFLEIVPLAHRIRRSYSQVAKAMTLIFEIPVQITSNYKSHTVQLDNNTSLGAFKLGINFTTSGNLNDRNQDVTLEIGPMHTDRFKHFEADGNEGKILESLIDMLFPANCIVTTKFKIDEASASFTLGKTLGNNLNKANSFLGINTFLK